jgi:hypothetical protein
MHEKAIRVPNIAPIIYAITVSRKMGIWTRMFRLLIRMPVVTAGLMCEPVIGPTTRIIAKMLKTGPQGSLL